jgi:hypothetical protein
MTDDDDIPDSYEHPNWSPPWPQTSKQRQRTWDDVYDLEFRGYHAETIADGTNQSIDWSVDGKQW